MKYDLLKKVPIFSDLNKKELQIILETGELRRYAREEGIIQQGESGNTMFFIVSGKVKVVLSGGHKEGIVLSVLKEGEFFGELSLIDDEPRSCNIIAIEESSLFVLTRNLFHNICKIHPEIIIKVLREMARRLRKADEKIGTLAFLDVYGRTVQVLYEIANDTGNAVEDGILIERFPTHHYLASMIGTTRESVSRVIHSLRKTGHLKYLKGRKVVLRGRIRH